MEITAFEATSQYYTVTKLPAQITSEQAKATVARMWETGKYRRVSVQSYGRTVASKS